MTNLPKIVITSIPHRKQRYNTCGDYFKEGGVLNIRISKMNAPHEFLVLIHELTEWFLTTQRGIGIDEIDQFDIQFEKERKGDNENEPGDDSRAPYYYEHQFATQIEKLVAEELGVKWEAYDKHVKSL